MLWRNGLLIGCLLILALALPVCAEPPDTQAVLQGAKTAIADGKYDQVRDNLQTVLDNGPSTDTQAYVFALLGSIACKDGDAKKIDAAVSRLCDEQALAANRLCEYLDILSAPMTDRRPLALALQRYLQARPAHPYALPFFLSELHFFTNAGDANTALAEIRRQILDYPNPADIAALAKFVASDETIKKGPDTGQDILTLAAACQAASKK